MLDIKVLRQEPERIKEALKKRFNPLDIEPAIELDKQRRAILAEVEQKKAKQNEITKQIPQMKKNGENTDQIFAEMKELSNDIKADDEKVRDIDEQLRNFMLRIPNIPNPEVPVGKDDTENVELRKFSEPRKFDFEPKAHWDIGTDLDILDFERGTKIAGTRFTVYKGLGARLERAVIQFFLNTHTGESGYTEIFPPYMVNRASMTGTGQLPKFEEDAFKVVNNGFFLIPTAEVPVTNLHRDEILSGDQLPIKYTAYSACFRAEAGSAGRDTRGLIRQHQFNKVELVKFVKPETSYDELENLQTTLKSYFKSLDLLTELFACQQVTLVSHRLRHMILKYGCQATADMLKFLHAQTLKIIRQDVPTSNIRKHRRIRLNLSIHLTAQVLQSAELLPQFLKIIRMRTVL